jgi:hypothetical protein
MLVTLPTPYPRARACPSTPKVLRAKERAPTPCSSIIFSLDAHLSLQRRLGARHITNFVILFDNISKYVKLVEITIIQKMDLVENE